MTITSDSARNQHGRVVRTPADIERNHRAAELKSRGLSYREVAKEMECSVSTAYDMVQRAIADIPREDTESLRAMELARLDFRERVLLGILGKFTPRVSASGKVVLHNGEVVEDYDVKIRAVAGLGRISERRAKLLGLDAALQVEMKAVVYDGGTIEGQVERLRQLLADSGGSARVLDGPQGALGAGPTTEPDLAHLPLPGGSQNGKDPHGGGVDDVDGAGAPWNPLGGGGGDIR